MKQLILLLSLLLAEVYTECPSGCTCTETSVLCINKQLEILPSLNMLSNDPLILDFSGNNFPYLSYEDFDFLQSSEVKELYLNNSGIGHIENDAFNAMENLQELYLGENYLNIVAKSLIEQLSDIILLDMSNNYFNEKMPVICSNSLEVLGLANSKISYIPHQALKCLPNLRLLLLQQNNIRTLTYNIFENYAPSSLLVKLSFNSWQCNCDNINAFKLLENNNFVDPSESYQCQGWDNKMIDIYGKYGAIVNIGKHCENSNEKQNNNLIVNFTTEVRAMIDEDRKDSRNLISSKEKENNADVKSTKYVNRNEHNLEENHRKNTQANTTIPNEIMYDRIYNSNVFFVVLICILTSFFLGFLIGIIFCSLIRIEMYKKFKRTSDSQVQLLRA